MSSLSFYFWGEGYFVLILVASVSVNYLLGILLPKALTRSKRLAGCCLAVGVFANLALLFTYKYLGFVMENLSIANQFFSGPALPQLELVLPIGISFFTFQALSYLVDVYREEVSAEKNPIALALYISLFPQLIAGPIVRYSTIREEIGSRVITHSAFAYGALRFIQGLSKKLLLADPLAKIVDLIYGQPLAELSSSLAWLAAFAYTLQIYLDFSGYSDMAIGLGRMFGFTFLENFNYPYISKSLREFWRRWHISLSTWFRDYLYIPLGGNRYGSFRTSVNLFIVFVLCGLWHGASWNFLLWGLLHGVVLSLERFKFFDILANRLGCLRTFGVFMFLVLSWVLFRADSLRQAVWMYKRLFFLESANPVFLQVSDLLTMKNVFVLVVAVFISLLPRVVRKLKGAELQSEEEFTISICLAGFYFSLLLLCVLQIVAGSYSPFIYFRF